MKILNASQIKEWDNYTILNTPISSLELMEKAVNACVDWLTKKYPDKSTKFQVFCGNGNNGGDGLAISRILLNHGYNVRTFIVNHSIQKSTDNKVNYEKLKITKNAQLIEINNSNDFEMDDDAIIIDAILGTGVNKPLEGLIADVVIKINDSVNSIVAIDTPTGLIENISNTNFVAIHATHTLTFEVPKLQMMFKENYKYVGDFTVLNIGLLHNYNESALSQYYFITSERIKKILKKRFKFDHKGIFGHSLLIVGSYGKMGAAVLSAKASMRSGVGKLTVACPKSGYEIIQTCVPEAMAYTIEEHEKYVTFFPKISGFDSIGIGPGIEKRPVTKQMLRNLLSQKELPPMVLDADALNLIAEILKESPDFKIPKNSILTPHLKEFERLSGESVTGYERHLKQIEFSKKHEVTVVLKGAYSGVSFPDGTYYFNSTGNPGMATAGSGDVLTGIIAGLLAQKYSLKDAALLGIYLHGLAGNLAAEVKTEYALIAGDIIDYIGSAYHSLTD